MDWSAKSKKKSKFDDNFNIGRLLEHFEYEMNRFTNFKALERICQIFSPSYKT